MLRLRYWSCLALGVFALFVSPGRAQVEDDALFDAATGYRIARYRSPVSNAPEGVWRASLDEVAALRAQGALLVDVTPVLNGRLDNASGKWLLAEEWQTIPGALWLPEAGRGDVDPVIEAWFLRNIETRTGGDLKAAMVVFCLSDCWMSWNAARRLALAGYAAVYWYPEGVDGWREDGLALAPVTPPDVAYP